MEAFCKPDVIPINFNVDDPFNDLSEQLKVIERDVSDGDITDIVIIVRRENEVTGRDIRTLWRGENPLTTALGMIKYADESLTSRHIRGDE